MVDTNGDKCHVCGWPVDAECSCEDQGLDEEPKEVDYSLSYEAFILFRTRYLNDPYSASTRQAEAEREARKIAIANRLGQHD